MFELTAAEATPTYADHVARLHRRADRGLRRRHGHGQPGHRAPDRGRRQARRRRARRAHDRGLRRAVDGLPARRPLRRAGPPAPSPAGRSGRARCTTAAARWRSTSARRRTRRRSPSWRSRATRRPRSGRCRSPAAVPLRTVRGTLAELAAADGRPATPGCGSTSGRRPGPASRRRCRRCCRGRWRSASTRTLLPDAGHQRPARPAAGRSPRELFAEYLDQPRASPTTAVAATPVRRALRGGERDRR